MSNLTVIIPFAQRKFDSHSLWRLNNAVRCFGTQVDVLVYDTSATSNHAGLQAVLQSFNTQYVHEPKTGLFSPGAVRNQAVRHVSSEYLLFFDADHLCDKKFVNGLPQKVEQLKRLGESAFFMFPFLYLTKQATLKFSGDFSGCLASYLAGENHIVEAIALSTCCLLLSRQHFLRLGGFDESYRGHGCEDFDLVHKLCTFSQKIQRPKNYYSDVKQRFPANYEGFRRYFSYYALPHLFAGEFVLHQWHPRPPNAYHKQRAHNEAMLQQNMRQFDCTQTICHPLLDPPSMVDFINATGSQYGYAPEQMIGLFRWRQGVVDQNVLTRKLKKFLRNPAQFVKDIKVLRRCFSR